MADDADQRLTRAVISDWQRRLGELAGAPVGEHDMHLRGRAAADFYRVDGLIHDDELENFEFYMYVRELSLIPVVYSALRAPVVPAQDKVRALDQSDVLAVSTPLSRPAYRLAGGRRLLTRPGDLSITRHVVTAQLSDTVADWAGIVLPTSLLGQRRAAAIEQSWIPVVSGSLLARATASFIASFSVATATGVVPPPSGDTQLAAIDLIASALGEMAGVSSSLTDNPLFVREAVLDLIERRYADPDFGVDDIARELHLSLRQVYRYFEDSEQSLAGRIAQRRVVAATVAFRSEPRTPIGNIARRAGFASAATFRNRFRAAVGIGPTEYRAMLLSGEPVPEVATVD